MNLEPIVLGSGPQNQRWGPDPASPGGALDTMGENDFLVLIPGLFGFAEFGTPPRGFAYFDRVIDILTVSTGIPRTRILVHKPEPTGPLWMRVRSLYDKLEQLLAARPDARLFLVGHSTGGLDARLLANSKYLWPGGPVDRRRLLTRIATVVTLSAPLHGTPIARRLRGAMEATIPELYLLSILAKSRAIDLRARTVLLYTTVMQALSGNPHSTVPLAALEGFDAEIARQVRAFLDDIVDNHALVHDLTPLAMRILNGCIAGGDAPTLYSFVTVAPPPSAQSVLGSSFAGNALQTAIYALAYSLTRPSSSELAVFPRGPWILPPQSESRLRSPGASDGVVPVASQTLDGLATGIVEGDHLDVVGHFESREFHGVTVFRSGAGFSDQRLHATWTAIAKVLARPS